MKTPQTNKSPAAVRDLGAELLESVRQMKEGRAAKTYQIDTAQVPTASMTTGLSNGARPGRSNVS